MNHSVEKSKFLYIYIYINTETNQLNIILESRKSAQFQNNRDFDKYPGDIRLL